MFYVESKPHSGHEADMTYFGKSGSFTVSGEESELEKLRDCIRNLEEQYETLQFAAARLCNVHRWSYGGPETLIALADRIAESYPAERCALEVPHPAHQWETGPNGPGSCPGLESSPTKEPS